MKHIDEALPAVLQRYGVPAIETVYRGTKYRSRLEARWAVFFDSLGLRFEYEAEGFDLGDSVLYLPDFWMPDLKLWVEIKGNDPIDHECEKAQRLAETTGYRVQVFYGGHQLPDQHTNPSYAFFPNAHSADAGYLWCECSDCGVIGIEYEGRSDRLSCKECYLCAYYRKHGRGGVYGSHDCREGGCKRHGGNLDKGRNAASPRLYEAYRAARAMRFGR